MKFDADRAVALAKTFPADRFPGSPAEWQAAESVAERLTAAGFHVEREAIETPADPEAPSATIALGAILAGSLLLATTWAFGMQFGPDPLTLGMGFVGLMLLGLIEHKLKTGSWGAVTWKRPLVHAWNTTAADAPARVVLVSRTAARPARRARTWKWRLGLIETIWLAGLILPCFYYGSWTWLSQSGAIAMILLGVIALLWPLACRLAPAEADNRTGLALLVELAQDRLGLTQPHFTMEFLALGGTLDETRVPSAWTDRPTLVIALDAPGVGTRLRLFGPQRALAVKAARDLWLPADIIDSGSLPLRTGFGIGAESDTATIQPATIAATAQLIEEVARRWSKTVAT